MPFRFLDFPRELRDTVYKRLFEDDEITYEPKFLSKPTSTSAVSRLTQSSRFGLLFTSHQLSTETLYHIYHHVPFILILSDLLTCDFTSWAISPSVLRRIRHATFLHNYNCAFTTTCTESPSALNTWHHGFELEISIQALIPSLPSLRKLNLGVILLDSMTDSPAGAADDNPAAPIAPTASRRNVAKWVIDGGETGYEDVRKPTITWAVQPLVPLKDLAHHRAGRWVVRRNVLKSEASAAGLPARRRNVFAVAPEEWRSEKGGNTGQSYTL